MFSSRRSNIILIGPEKAGKSALLASVLGDGFNEEYQRTSTIVMNSLYLDKNQESTKVKIFDLSGSPGLRAIQNRSYQDADAFMLVLDLTDESSATYLQQYYDEIKELDRDKKLPRPIIVVGTKIDLTSATNPTVQALIAKTTELQCPFIKTSAKTGHNVKKAFGLGHEAIGKYNDQRQQSPQHSQPTPESKETIKIHIQNMEEDRANKFTNIISRHRYKIIFSILAAAAIAVGIATGGIAPAIALGVAGLIGVGYTVGLAIGVAAAIVAGTIVGTLIGAIVDKISNKNNEQAAEATSKNNSTANMKSALSSKNNSKSNPLSKSPVADIYSTEEIANDNHAATKTTTQEPPSHLPPSPRK